MALLLLPLALPRLLAGLPLPIGRLRVVAQLQFLAQKLAHLVEGLLLLAHLLIVGAVLIALRRLQIVEEVLELIEHPLGAVTLAVLGHVVELVEHRLKVALAEHLHVAVGLLRARILLGALGKLADIAVERLAKLGHALLDLLLGGAVGERILQGVLGGPKRVERPRRAVAFDDQCEFPQIGRDIAKLVIVHGRGKGLSDRPQADVDAGFRHEFFRRDHERVEGLEHLRTRVGIERELAPLLDERACQRLGEGMRRQGEAHRFAGALEPGLVLGGEPKRHVGSCPRVGGKIEVSRAGGAPGRFDGGARLAIGGSTRGCPFVIGCPCQRGSAKRVSTEAMPYSSEPS